MESKLSRIFFATLLLQFVHSQDFGYDGAIGPAYWGVKYQTCIGKYQSPIDIEIANVTKKAFPRLVFENFNKPIEKGKIENNGHTVVFLRLSGVTPSIKGGPLNGRYNFHQLHFHWGRNNSEGSENTINNHSFPLELHMVFFKSDYGTFQESLQHVDGLTVLSYLFHTTILDNPHYVTFENKMGDIMSAGSSIDVHELLSLDQFSTTERNKYFTYNGSLTTPPCSEIVTWIEFLTTIPLSHGQIERFRELSSGIHKLDHNFRPTQLLYDREIYFNSALDIAVSNVLLFGIIVIHFMLK